MSRLTALAFIVVAADQATKWWIRAAIPVGEVRTVLPALLHFTHVYNPGAAFGLLPDARWLFLGAAAAVFVYAWLRREEIRAQPFAMRLGIALGLAGAAGNVIDRLWRGAVLDFIDVFIIPVFNVADMAITTGVSCILWAVVLDRSAGADAED